MRIGILALIAVALAATTISGSVFAYPGETDTQIINQYCIDNALRVSMGEDVISELIGAGLVSSDYANQTCHDVQVQGEIDEHFFNLMDELIVTP